GRRDAWKSCRVYDWRAVERSVGTEDIVTVAKRFEAEAQEVPPDGAGESQSRHPYRAALILRLNRERGLSAGQIACQPSVTEANGGIRMNRYSVQKVLRRHGDPGHTE